MSADAFEAKARRDAAREELMLVLYACIEALPPAIQERVINDRTLTEALRQRIEGGA